MNWKKGLRIGIIGLLIIGLLNLGKTSTALAAEDLRVEVQADYVIAASAAAKVKVDFKLTNTSPTTFVESYQLKIPTDGVSAVVLQPKKEEIDKTVTTEGEWQIFDLKFRNEVVGQGKAREFALEYDDTDLVTVRGKNVIVRILAIEAAKAADKYIAKLTVPTSFGEASKISPEPIRVNNKAGQVVYTFDVSGGKEVLVQYGEVQTSQFRWEKILENKSNATTYMQLNLPVNDEKRTFIYAFLTPMPDHYQVSGQEWQLFYLIKPWREIKVSASGYAVMKEVDERYQLKENLPEAIKNEWQDFFVDAIAEEVLKQNQATPKMQVNLDNWWFLPLPGRLKIAIYNQGGEEKNNWLLKTQLMNGDKVEIVSEETVIKLMPWQKTEAKIYLKNEKWWPIYQETKVKLTLLDETGLVMQEKIYDGITLAYPTLAVIGGIFAAAITAGSLLVARKK